MQEDRLCNVQVFVVVVSAIVGGLQMGVKHHFAVAGDSNLVLLDDLLMNKKLSVVAMKLNCGYAAEGYARACRAAATVVTFGVGGLSATNTLGCLCCKSPGHPDVQCTQHQRPRINNRDDCSPEPISWGRLVERASARSPSRQ